MVCPRLDGPHIQCDFRRHSLRRKQASAPGRAISTALRLSGTETTRRLAVRLCLPSDFPLTPEATAADGLNTPGGLSLGNLLRAKLKTGPLPSISRSFNVVPPQTTSTPTPNPEDPRTAPDFGHPP